MLIPISTFIQAFQEPPLDVSVILSIILIIVIAFVLERLSTRYVRNFAKRTDLMPHTTNNLVLTIRILILVGATMAIFSFSGLPSSWVLAISAILGGAIGFASNQTIGNFIAGFFLLAARPMKVGDYIRIGQVEGIVKEIAINYTRILTREMAVVVISNLQLLSRDIVNYASEESMKSHLTFYNFEISFDHRVSGPKINEILNDVLTKYSEKFLNNPTFSLDRFDSTGRVYKIKLCVKDPQDIFDLKPKIIYEIIARWDAEQLK